MYISRSGFRLFGQLFGSRFGRSFGHGSSSSAPTNTVAPTIAGNRGIGATLTGTPGTWTQAPVLTYQWQRSGVNIGGATSLTYAQVTADAGTDISLLEIPNGNASAAKRSNVLTINLVNYAQDISGLIAIWPGDESSGTVFRALPSATMNGATSGGVTRNVASGMAMFPTVTTFDGTNGMANVFTAALAAAFDSTKYTKIDIFRVSGAGDWTDGALRAMSSFNADNNNQAYSRKQTANNTTLMQYRAASTNSPVTVTPISSTGWLIHVATLDKGADEFKGYNSGTLIATATGLATWTGALTAAVIGAATAAAGSPWKGQALSALYNRALTPTEVAAWVTAAGF